MLAVTATVDRATPAKKNAPANATKTATLCETPRSRGFGRVSSKGENPEAACMAGQLHSTSSGIHEEASPTGREFQELVAPGSLHFCRALSRANGLHGAL